MNKIQYYFALLRSLLPSMYVCLKYLPFKQAVKLPILIYKPHHCLFKGNIKIDTCTISTGMIKFGFPTSVVYPNNGISLRIEGNVIFKGKCYIGNDSYIVVGKQGKLIYNDDFKATCSLKLICMYDMYFGKHTLCGWEVTIIDSNFHPLYNIEKKEFKKAFDNICISDNNWFAMRCLVLPGAHTPRNCVFGAKTIVTAKGTYEPNCVYGGNPIRVLSRNVERIIGQDYITEYK